MLAITTSRGVHIDCMVALAEAVRYCISNLNFRPVQKKSNISQFAVN